MVPLNLVSQGLGKIKKLKIFKKVLSGKNSSPIIFDTQDTKFYLAKRPLAILTSLRKVLIYCTQLQGEKVG